MPKYCHYLRVSTNSQGIDGYGIDAQRLAVKSYPSEIEFVEVESGRKKNRPKLLQALEYCRKNNAVLVIAKLDRLARNVAFVSSLMESGVEFVAADFPTANRLTIHILAAVAEHEARMISTRTREGLASAKARGVKLGSSMEPDRQKKGRESQRRQAAERAENMKLVKRLRNDSGLTLHEIADTMNQTGVQTARGKSKWYPMTVKRVLSRLQSDCI